MKKLLSILLAGTAAFGQSTTTVALSKGQPNAAFTSLYFWDGSSNLEYVCIAPAQRSPQYSSYTWAITPSQTQGTLTNIVVSANVGTATTSSAHGLAVNNLVTVASSTTSALNGNYVVLTVPSSTTFTFATSGVSNATYNNAAMTLTTTAPLTILPYWNIEKRIYNGSNLLTTDQFSVGTASGGLATTAYSFKCSDRAVTSGATKIAYQ